ncbi:ATP F0F1 synthase subunit I [Siculibacillus lacustris]|uniref:ATP F0F1 synthase subunit I n=1 Tax=Siculibacillus lacustris TaxID=1549641 RepID=A0A4Q9VCM9_9HYPH|nr:AtpZ/AtpI family protein [Siculibacillus lacustris]TBW32321.1 ATP F0F1 synthase subunit I [Siculibacillus lacustris]
MVDRPDGDHPRPSTGGDRAEGGEGAPETKPALAARLERLGASLEAHRSEVAAAKAKGRPSGFGQAIKIASEFVAGIVVGAALGWGIDRALGTSPWALIVFLLLGFAAGVLNVLRAEGKVADAGARLRAAGAEKSRSPSEPSDE